jgi:hypothetical protein
MKNWIKMMTMAIVGAVFLIGVTGAQAIMTNGTETTYTVTASNDEVTFVWDENSQYELSFLAPRVTVDTIIDGDEGAKIYEFVIPNFYDPLPKKTVEITMTGANSDASGVELAEVLDVIGSDSLFGEDSPALPAYGEFVNGSEQPTIVNQLWNIFPNPDYEIVKIWVPNAFNLVSIEIVTQSVSPPNQPPEAKCQDVTVSTEPGICSADTSVDDGSFDPDVDEITLDQDPPGPYELGDTEVTLTVTDDKGASDTCEAMVTVVDEEAPVISSVTASPNRLWPPNHNMIPVVLAVDATDNCDFADLVCQIESVASNEPVNGLGDGDTSPDWVITGDLTVNLRAERSGAGSGRIYTITVECTDLSGNSSTDTTEVSVPHDQGNSEKRFYRYFRWSYRNFR